MTKKKLILLVGLHKTGTTSIQSACRENVRSLAEAGYFYPLPNVYFHSPDPYPENHSKIFQWMFVQLVAETAREQVRSHFLSVFRANENALILSAELISALTRNELREMNDYFRGLGYEIAPICVVRKPVGWTASMIAQRVSGRRERLVGFQEAINEFLTKGSILRARIENIRSVFPQTLFVPFNELVSNPKGPAGWFFDRLGVSANIAQPKTNESVSDHSARLASAITEKAPAFQTDPHVYLILIRKYPALTQIPGEKFHLREPEIAPLLQILIDENQWLKRTFGEGFHDDEIKFSNRPVLLNDEQRKFMIDNLSNLPEPIIQSAVAQYMAEH